MKDFPIVMKDFPPLDLTNTINQVYGIQEQIEEANRRRIRDAEKIQQEKKNEELRKEREINRRHEELLAVLKDAINKGTPIIIGDNASGIQIQQNSAGANQTMNYIQEFDYEKARSVLLEIKEYTDFPKFYDTFGTNADNVKSIIDDALEAINNKEDEGIIKKSLKIIRDLAVGAGSSLIASGIIALLETLPL